MIAASAPRWRRWWRLTPGVCLRRARLPAPDAPAPAAYKEAWKPGPLEKGWAPSRPSDAIDRGAWWSIFHDPVLDGLERQIDISNQNLKAAEAAFREAEAIVAAGARRVVPDRSTQLPRRRARAAAAAHAAGLAATSRTISAPTLNGELGPRSVGHGPPHRRKRCRQRPGQRRDARQRAARRRRRRSPPPICSCASPTSCSGCSTRVGQGLHPGAADHHQNQYRRAAPPTSRPSHQAQAQLEGTQAQLIAVGVSARSSSTRSRC